MQAVIAGNWKMNHGPQEAERFFAELDGGLGSLNVRCLIFPPTLSFQAAAASRPDYVEIGVQNVYFEESGAFTGEVSPEMAREAGATCALVGHSERRHVFGETDEHVRRKVAACFRAGIFPVVCVGETLEERRAGRVEEVIRGQLSAALDSVEDRGQDAHFMVAYEPVWAIGTGETATPEDASEAHRTLRSQLDDAFGASGSGSVPILYGGSVKPTNAAALLASPEVGGVLVGGASLTPASFAEIARAAG